MVDFNKKVHNSDKFRGPALFFQEHGCYTTAPRGTTDYVKYWDEETKKCLEGWVAPDGDPISGYHYFYLNYFPILRLVETKYKDKYGEERTKFVRETEFADFYDYDYYFFNAFEQAEEKGKHMAVLKARGRGYSFKAASMLVRNYELIPASQNFAVASEQGYLTNDGILTKAWAGMDFIDKHTAWAKQRLVDTKLKRTSGFKITDEFGKQIEDGYKSSIIGVTLKNNPDRIRGIRGRLIVWEEAGKFNDILQAWQIARPSVEDTGGNAFGTMLCFGTGGTEGAAFDGLKEMFYHPDGYNIDSYSNIWDEKAEDQKCAFFCPAWSNVTTIDPVTRQRLYMDKDGNSLRIKATEFCIKQREEVQNGASEQVTVDRYVAENPLTPQESILEIGGNIFPKKLLMQQLARIRTNVKLQNMKHIVDLAWDGDGNVKAIEKKTGDITEYPLPKDKKPHGSVVIWEYPIKDPPFGLYIGGTDPYDHDDSFTNSLGSTFIYKRFKAGEAWNDVIVAEYSGRPDTAEEYYENVRKLLIFYNARLLFENERKGIYPYFTNKHCDYLLADQPDKVISEVFKDSKVQRRKGCHMTKSIRQYGEGLIKEWLEEEYEPGHPNLERIYSEPLLEELILNDGVRNVDRVIALCMVMIYREELYQVRVKDAKEMNKKVELFDMPLFGTQWWQSVDNQDDSNDDPPPFLAF